MKLDFSADRLISMGIILLKAIIILVAGHYITLFLIKMMKRTLNKINIDISLEKFLEKALYITLQPVEKVQFLLGFFCVLWYNKVGDKNDSKRQNT